MTIRPLSILGFFFLTSACSDKVWIEPNLDHCALNEGDRYCAERFPERPYCVQGQGECALGDRYGCLAEVPAECRMPCGTLDEDECVGVSSSGSETEASSGSGSDSGSSESSSTTGPMPCVSDEDCTDAAAPFCGTAGECGTCDGTIDGDAACAGIDAMAPLCVGEACVACTPENPVVCDELLLLCDGGTNACVACDEHAQCGSGACELAVGTCFPEDFVVHVDGDGGQDYMSVVAAVNAIAARGAGVIVVHELDGGADYGPVLIDADKRIALLAAAGERPILQGTGGAPGISVAGAGTILYMEGLEVSLAAMNAVGLRVNDAFAWVDRSRIVQNSGGGVLAENGAELTLRNCFVGGADNSAALEVDGSTARVTFSTLGGGTITATGLSCTAPEAVQVRSSIIVALGIMATGGVDVACSVADITYTATEASYVGTGNATVGELPFMTPQDWFLDYGTGNFHLQNDGLTLFAEVARWTLGDPLTDIDGDPRPAIDGASDYAGADVPQ